jgi:mannose-1-phosphate guanylyltransferase/mannose-6-phosphate isomerase
VTDILPVILCGGAGTRLWPVSREALPKQFVPLIGDKTLLQCAFERAAHLSPRTYCVANVEHRFLIEEVANRARLETVPILEPVARNTAAAMACASLLAIGADLLLFMPADHYIPDCEAFAASVRQAAKAAQSGYLVTFGVTPSSPTRAYGYLRQGTPLKDSPAFRLDGFVEKPSPERARQFFLSGGYFWNAGIFLVQPAALIAAFERHAPDILAACRKATDKANRSARQILLDKASFQECRAESIDYAVLEKHDHLAMIPFSGLWSDMGSWEAVAQLYQPDDAGNRLVGEAHALDCRNIFVTASNRLAVALGMQDALIIDTPDALLVAGSGQSERVKEVVSQLKLKGAWQATHHGREIRPWGHFETLDLGDRYRVKRITVRPGGQLSLQMHKHRAEHWTVVAGTARVTRADEIFELCENQSTFIPLGAWHRLENPGDMNLEIIEVQVGSYLGEDDIVRSEDRYGRVT